MAFERKKNQCGLFPNTVSPDKSDFNGQIDVECAHCSRTTAFWMNGFRKATKAGSKYLKLILRPKRIGEHGRTGATPPVDDSDMDDIL